MGRENVLSTTLTPSAQRALAAHEGLYGQKATVCAALLAFDKLPRDQQDRLIQAVNAETARLKKRKG